MNLSIKRTLAIFVKDYKEFSRNLSISIVIILTPLLSLIYAKLGIEQVSEYYLLFNMTFTIVATYVQSCLIAEEKEKNTLRGLLLSPVSTADILVGKSLLTFLVTGFTLVLCVFLSGYTPENMFIIISALFISTLFYISLGTLIGLFTKSVIEASVYSIPVIGIFSVSSFVRYISDDYPILKIAHYLPNIKLIEIAEKVEDGKNINSLFGEFSVILMWFIVTLILALVFYKKRMVD